MNQNTHKIKEAAALSYDSTKYYAPILTAKGKGETAERIIDLARENEIPIQEDSSLIHLLSQLQINESIPEELYKVVAELFAFIYRVDRDI